MNTLYQLIGYLLIFFLLACGGSPSASDDGDPPADDDPAEDTTPPSSPSGLEGNSGDTIVELSWATNGESDLSGYNLYRSEENFSGVSGIEPVNGSQLLADTDYTDEGLSNGNTYYYRITAVDGDANESGASALVEVTPFSDPPTRP